MARFRKVLFNVLSTAMFAVASGCMSFDHVLDSDQKLEMYGGTKSSYAYIEDETAPFFGTLIRLIDLPLTAVMDTLLLPVSAPVEMSRD